MSCPVKKFEHDLKNYSVNRDRYKIKQDKKDNLFMRSLRKQIRDQFSSFISILYIARYLNS